MGLRLQNIIKKLKLNLVMHALQYKWINHIGSHHQHIHHNNHQKRSISLICEKRGLTYGWSPHCILPSKWKWKITIYSPSEVRLEHTLLFWCIKKIIDCYRGKFIAISLFFWLLFIQILIIILFKLQKIKTRSRIETSIWCEIVHGGAGMSNIFYFRLRK